MIIVASVSCIYGIGAPIDYGATVLNLKVGGKYRRDGVLRHLVDLQYQRNDAQLTRSKFRVAATCWSSRRCPATTSCGSTSSATRSSGSWRSTT